MEHKSNDYWTLRSENLWKGLEKDENKQKKKLNDYYDKEASKLEKEIGAFYTKYGKDDILEYQNLLQQLSNEDKDLLYQRYDEFARKYPQYAKLEDIRNNIYKLNRLEGLNASIHIQQLEMGAEEHELYDGHFQKVFDKTAKSVSAGLNREYHGIDNDLLQKTINTKWVNGGNYSDRIWNNRDKLAKHIQTEVRNAIVRGDSIQDMQKELRKRFDVSKSDAFRLLVTETAFLKNETDACYFEKDYEEYEVLSVLDNKTSTICENQDGKRYKYADRAVGINFPPFHPGCRTDVLPVVPSDDGSGTRVARDYKGNNIEIPSDFTYSEYKKVMDTYKEIELAEPVVTKTLTETTSKNKGEMKGLEFKLKTLESLLRKISADATEKGISYIDATSKINDVLRYTSVANESDLVYNYNTVIKELKRQKHTHIQTKNTWFNGSAYKGINTVFETPEGYPFELQFHTDESFELKNGELHKLYEEFRSEGVSFERQNELSNEMKQLSSELKHPKDIANIKNYKKKE